MIELNPIVTNPAHVINCTKVQISTESSQTKCIHSSYTKETPEGVSTTDYQSYIDDLGWWFPPPRIYLKAHENIDPVALYDELEYADGLPDYSDIPHGSNVEPSCCTD